MDLACAAVNRSMECGICLFVGFRVARSGSLLTSDQRGIEGLALASSHAPGRKARAGHFQFREHFQQNQQISDGELRHDHSDPGHDLQQPHRGQPQNNLPHQRTRNAKALG